ncbi:MAG: hypothetical protein EXS16_05350 [Gemmataceae bacterium]|nr:hypothetical protein [Gemmataceae bacterium]
MKMFNTSPVALVALAVTVLLLGIAGPANAGSATLDASSPILVAYDYFQIIGNRPRMIQFSLVAVALGCSLLWWRR